MRRAHSLSKMLKLAGVPLIGLLVVAGLLVWALWSPLGGSPTAQATGPHLSVTKECSLDAGVFTFKFTLTNDGDTLLYRWKVLDSTLGNITWAFAPQIAVGETQTVTLTKVQVPGDRLCNWAEFSYRTAGWEEVVKPRPRCCVEDELPDLEIVKAGVHEEGCPAVATVGSYIWFEYTITNNGTQTLHRVSVIDDVVNDLTNDFPHTLNPGESATVRALYRVLESDPRPLVNTVEAIYETAAGVQVTATDSCSTDIPHLTVEKTASLSSGGPFVGVFTFEYEVTNDGSTPLRVMQVWDTTLGSITYAFPLQLPVGHTDTVSLTKLQLPGDPLCNTVRATYGWFRPGAITAVLGTDQACVP